jgi:hypothetical protein
MEITKVITRMTQETMDDLDFIRITAGLDGNNSAIKLAADITRDVINQLKNKGGKVILEDPDGTRTKLTIKD